MFVVASVWLDLLRPLVAFQLGAVIFPVFAYRSRTHQLVDQMRLLRRFDDLVLMNVAKGLLVAGRHGMVVRHNPHAAELLGLPTRHCAVIEDAVVGVQAANRAGCVSIALVVPGRDTDLFHQAGHIVRDLNALSPAVIQQWLAE